VRHVFISNHTAGVRIAGLTSGKSAMQLVVKLLLRLMAASFRYRPALRKCLKSDQGWIDFTAGIRTRSGSVETAIRFHQGRVSVLGAIPPDTDIALVFKSDAAVRKFLTATPTTQVYMALKNDFYTVGSASYLNLFVYCLSLLLNRKQVKLMEKERRQDPNSSRRPLLQLKPIFQRN
jgi:hypothetical protein